MVSFVKLKANKPTFSLTSTLCSKTFGFVLAQRTAVYQARVVCASSKKKKKYTEDAVPTYLMPTKK